MTVLAFDTATAACSAAVWRDGAVLSRRFAPMARGQSEALVPMLVEAMAEAGLAYRDLDLVAVTVGPGAFTGLRIGLATARAIGLAAGLPVAGVLTTEAIAAGIPAAERQGRTVVVAVDAKRADLFVQRFDETLAPLDEVRALLPEEVAALLHGPVLLAGDGVPRLAPLLPEAVVSTASGVPEAWRLAPLAEARWRAGTALPPRPVYLRPPDVTLPAARP